MGWKEIDGEFYYEVEALSTEGMYSRYRGGSGQGLIVDAKNLRENLSLDEISNSLEGRIGKMRLADGVHSVSVNRIGAVFSDEEKDTLGGIVIDVVAKVRFQEGKATIISGEWQQSIPDLYNFSPVLSSHRSFFGNAATLLENVFRFVTPPYTAAVPFKTVIDGARKIELSLGPLENLSDQPSPPTTPQKAAPPPTTGPASPPTTVQTPAGPKVVNPGSTYVPPGSAPPPAPKPVMPPSVTWGQMANPRLPAGAAPPPTAPVQPKLMPNPSPSNRDRQDGPRESGSDRPDDPRFSGGGSGNRNSGGGGGTGSGNSGGGGSGGSGSGSGGGGYVNNGNNPGNKNAPGYNGSSSNSNGGGYVNNGNNPGNKNAPGYNGSGNQNNNNNNNNKNVGNGPARDTSRTGAARPIILDLGGDGFDVSFTGTARFDMDGDGFRERVGWADAQDALLVLDLNADGSRGAGDGKIDQAKELVLSLWAMRAGAEEKRRPLWDRIRGVRTQGVGGAGLLCVYAFIPGPNCRRMRHPTACASGADHPGSEKGRKATRGTGGNGRAIRWPRNRAMPGPGPTASFRRLPCRPAVQFHKWGVPRAALG